MKPKDYQIRTLETVRAWLDGLAEMREKAAKLAAIDPDLAASFDFPEAAWKKVSDRAYQKRRTGNGDPLPSACIKIPTGGGKTYIATRVIDLANTIYLRRQSGLVLWIVPSTQIYNQTLAALRNRSHPYRQQLDIASANRTLILEKTRRFRPEDIRENLCVLLLMLPSANRETKETLRMFRDSGGFERFFPRDGDHLAHAELLKKVPNLDTFGAGEGGLWKRQIKTSLGNTLRLLRPIVILDEGHKGYSKNALATIGGFNPSLLVELSATPPDQANVLVNVPGRELEKEGMIKLDLHLLNRGQAEWTGTLLAAARHREMLEKEADRHEAETGVYIRPICLIQVERTGKDQRKAGMIHAEDARDYLLKMDGVRPEHIAVKTSEKDELKEIDDTGGLMARDCEVRYIITKQALQEGWDCPFAYVLAILTNPGSKTALTQLVGRVLRQPYAVKTHVPLLDESYVFCFQRRGKDLLEEVRRGFGMEGLGDLAARVVSDMEGKTSAGSETAIDSRASLKDRAKKYILPAFMIKDPVDDWRPVHYEADLLVRVPWNEVDVSPLFDLTLNAVGDQNVAMSVGLEQGILTGDPEWRAERMDAGGQLDVSFAASHVLDVMPNPWRGAELARKVFDKLADRYDREILVDNYVFILEELHKRIESERDRLAEVTFRNLLEDGTMRFVVIGEDFARLPVKEIWKTNERRATRDDAGQFMLSLFEQMPEGDFNTLETTVATFLDRQEQLLYFWHRNASKRGYFVQGWKRNRIFADFIAAGKPVPEAEKGFDRIYVLETKGLHLRNADTTYKQNVFKVCNDRAHGEHWADFAPTMRNTRLRFEVVFEDEWQDKLSSMLAG
ncbi:MAG: DEAD/DEAH box helicase family protein [Luteolibacter sp.]|jgi:type III restriction enzyme|nr:DEAD/DEAH box helicase family protein [Luteolibacter sp.]